MSHILARIRVTETHGIRRFLYPLTALGVSIRDNDVDTDRLCLVSDTGEAIPIQVTHTLGERFRVDFAVSLAPGEAKEYQLIPGTPKIVNDPLQITKNKDGHLLQSRQQRFEITLLEEAQIGSVIYDGIDFLRSPMTITQNDDERDLEYPATSSLSPSGVTLNAWAGVSVSYKSGRRGVTEAAMTACKSWATLTHTIHSAKTQDELVFILPLAVTSPTLTCDFGIGGYVFGKLQAGAAEEIVWRTQFTEKGIAQWTVATAGRVDYVGATAAAGFLSQRWFHVIDSDKSLAVAMTDVPSECAEMTVTLRSHGDVIVAFRLGDVQENTTAKFGVCCHFLNDVPAIAAATSPQSILLPPTVDVLSV